MIKHSVFILFVFSLLAGCKEDIGKINVLIQNKSDLPVEIGENVLIEYTDSGFVRAKVYAPEMKRYAGDDKNETVMGKGMTVYFLGRDKKVESFLKSKYAVRYDRDRKMMAKDDVVLVNVKGDTLRTELLNWDENKQLIYTNQFVRITTPEEIITGTGFESNAEFTRYKISKISGTFDLSK